MYQVENDQELQHYYAETDRLRALTELLAQMKSVVIPPEITDRTPLLIDQRSAVEEALEAVRQIAGRSSL